MGKSVKEIIEEAIYIAGATGRQVICTAMPPDWSHYQTVEALEAAFLAEVERLIGIYGEAATETAFRQIIPDFGLASPTDMFGFEDPTSPVENEETPLMERKLHEGILSKAAKFFRNLFKKGGKKAPKSKAAAAAGGAGVGGAAVAGGLAGAGGGLASGLATSFIDKDVDLANISTTDKLGVTIDRGSAPWLESLIIRTNELLQNLTDLLGQSQPSIAAGLTDMDANLDDMLANQTGQTRAQVRSQQGMYGKMQSSSKTTPPKEKETTEKSKEKDTKET